MYNTSRQVTNTTPQVAQYTKGKDSLRAQGEPHDDRSRMATVGSLGLFPWKVEGPREACAEACVC